MSDNCKHEWGFNTGAEFGGYRPSQVFWLRCYCVHCHIPKEEWERIQEEDAAIEASYDYFNRFIAGDR
jgi:hypothetical protein